MTIRIRAIDTLFFKDGKPFSMGEESWAESMFPPPPSALFGAIRTLYFTHNREEIPLINTAEDPTKNLEVKCINFSIYDSPYFIAPRDLVRIKSDSNEKEFGLLRLTQTRGITNNGLPGMLDWENKNQVVETCEGLVTGRSLATYINNNQWRKSTEVYPFNRYCSTEPKTGIGKNRQINVAEDGLLYRVGMKRFAFDDKENIEYLFINLRISGLPDNKIPNCGLMKLGGEGKSAYYKLLQDDLTANFSLSTKSRFFKMYLITPAIFKNGWYPSWLKWSEKDNTYEGEWQGLKLKLITAAIGKPLAIGGYDMYKKRPKPLFRAVPAGSVYYFHLEDNTQAEQLNDLQFISISETLIPKTTSQPYFPTTAQEGFGRVFFCAADNPIEHL